ncbi:tRNA lysidine(34) synthetase TilS [Rhizobium sp. L1K21]|uniref:tRNA lysidine(34) synthetase TilS n=1 Tax=Rhizobium sp. L1K21 TaxID=2954933 RepID=UPI002093EA0F|nr:tRNA lysidine(34) synthetase TilS [Rhizobium sp. L1K21]MCO6185108.1 tRNA lysidine(34) synthetase TilS [Rhizobium sp. L1K21]
MVAEAAVAGEAVCGPLEACRTFLERLDAPKRILVAISGGSDSTGLLVALSKTLQMRPAGFELCAATVDHGLRPGSLDEAMAVHGLCESLGIPHDVLCWKGDKPETGLMAAAREARYRLLEGAACRLGCDLIMTGHTLDDQIETVAMRGARSEVGRGLSGMAEDTLLNGRMWMFRPFLSIRRAAIRDFLREERVSWIDDPSNDNTRFERVRVRQEPVVGVDPSQIVSAGAARRRLAGGAAEAILSAAQCPLPGYYTMAAKAVDNEAGWLALKTLISVAGGQHFLPACEQADALRSQLADGGDFRHTLSRCVVERRGETLYLCRERRDLPHLVLQAGEIAIWDGRFTIENLAPLPIEVTAALGRPAFDDGVFAGTPKRVAALIRQVLPFVEDADNDRFRLTPYLAPFERFLTGFDFELARAVANAAGRAEFPRQILRSTAKK